jgi:hypothetical protein
MCDQATAIKVRKRKDNVYEIGIGDNADHWCQYRVAEVYDDKFLQLIVTACADQPAEAGEQVRGLVEAAQWLYNILDDCHECDGLPECQICDAAVKLQEALAKYRGGVE